MNPTFGPKSGEKPLAMKDSKRETASFTPFS